MFKIFAITLVLVTIFRKSDDISDEEIDPFDDGGPIYIDKSIQNFEEFIKPISVLKTRM